MPTPAPRFVGKVLCVRMYTGVDAYTLQTKLITDKVLRAQQAAPEHIQKQSLQVRNLQYCSRLDPHHENRQVLWNQSTLTSSTSCRRFLSAALVCTTISV